MNPKKPAARQQAQIRLSAEERKAFQKTAATSGLTWSEWARQVLRAAAGLPSVYGSPAKQGD